MSSHKRSGGFPVGTSDSYLGSWREIEIELGDELEFVFVFVEEFVVLIHVPGLGGENDIGLVDVIKVVVGKIDGVFELFDLFDVVVKLGF